MLIWNIGTMKPKHKFTMTIWVRPSYCNTVPNGPGGGGGGGGDDPPQYEFRSFITTTDEEEDDTPDGGGDPTPKDYEVATCRDESTIEVGLPCLLAALVMNVWTRRKRRNRLIHIY